MSRHSEITDQYEIHFPKGFTDAALDTFPVKTASGTMTWRDVRYYQAATHCAIQFGAPTLNTALTAMTLANTYYPVTTDSNLWTVVDSDGFTFVSATTTGYLQVDVTGHYLFNISFTAVGNASSATDDYRMTLSKGSTYDNASVLTTFPPILLEGPANNVHAGRSAAFYVEASAGEKVGLLLSSNGTDGLCIQSASITGILLHG